MTGGRRAAASWTVGCTGRLSVVVGRSSSMPEPAVDPFRRWAYSQEACGLGACRAAPVEGEDGRSWAPLVSRPHSGRQHRSRQRSTARGHSNTPMDQQLEQRTCDVGKHGARLT